MKKHMTLGQMFGAAYDVEIRVFQRGVKVEKENYDANLMQMPVFKIERDPEYLVAYVGFEKEQDDYDLTPTKDNMKSILDEAFGDWFDARKDDLIKEAIATGDYDDDIIERYLADTEYSSIDEMTEKLDELKEKVEEMESDLYEIYTLANKYC